MNDDILKKMREDLENKLYSRKNECALDDIESIMIKDFKNRNIEYSNESVRTFCGGIQFSMNVFIKEMKEDFITSIATDKDFRHAIETLMSTIIISGRLIVKKKKLTKDLDWLNNVCPKDPPKKNG